MKNPIKNQGGSALAYVLIFSVIIMVLVVGLLTVAQSGISFTQQTVESRQAYIDAKSVIEYGKTIINVWESELADANEKLATAKQNYESALAAGEDASALKTIYDTALVNLNKLQDENIKYYIYWDGDKVATSLKEDIFEDSTKQIVGFVFLETNSNSEEVYNTSKYTFFVETQDLRRLLDYQVIFDGGSGGGSDEPTDDSSGWLATQIKRKNTYQEIQCVIQKTGNTKGYDSVNKVLTVNEPALSLNIGKDKNNPNVNNTKFEWWQECDLILTAKNICFTAGFPTDANSVWKSEFTIKADDQIRIKQDYIQNNNDASLTNTFEADNIVFEGDLTLNNNANLEIDCKNLWIKGDLNIDSSGGTESKLIINAENIYIGDYENKTGGNVTVADRSQLNWSCTNNIMIRGDLKLLTNSASPENYLTAKNISIGTSANPVNMIVQNATRVIWNCDNFWLHGDMTTTTSGSYQEFNNIEYFQAGTINLSNKCTLKIDGKDSSDNQVIVDNIIPLESNAYTLEIKDLALFKCNGDLGLTDNSTMDLEADNILISGNVLFSFTNNINIKTDYLDILGTTTINRTYKEVLIDGLSNLKARFNGGYDQTNSTVTIRNADKTIFSGANFKFGGDGVGSATLNIASDSSYIDAQNVAFTQYYGSETVGFKYTAKNGTAGNLSLRQTVSWNPNNNSSTNTIYARDYQNVIGSFPQASAATWLYEQGAGTYTVPSWTGLNIQLQVPTEPTVPNTPTADENDPGDESGGGDSTVSEKYY